MAYRLPYKRNSSTDVVWTPSELKQITKQSSPEGYVREYVTRPSLDAPVRASTGGEQGHKHSITSQQGKDDKKKHSKTSDSHSLHLPRHSKRSSHRRSSGNQSHQTRHSRGGDANSLLQDWHNTAPWRHIIGFNLELWWRHSTSQQRINAGLLLLLLLMVVMHFVFGVWLIGVSFRKKIRDPYLCETTECHKAGAWISEFVNESENPCNNFYEFVCGNYHHETKSEGSYFEEKLQGPIYSIEFGEHSILASILKDYRNDPKQDQSIEYYRRCLNDPIRQEFGLEALLETVKYVFGTRDFTQFEKGKLSLEEIGARMFEVVGHASFINMAFYTYPHVLILRPSLFFRDLQFEENPDNYIQNNPNFTELALQGLLPLLGVQKGSKLMEEMMEGINMITGIAAILHDTTSKVVMPKESNNLGDKGYQKFLKRIQRFLFDGGHCPPMGSVKLDMEKVLLMWLKEPDYRIEYLDLMALKFFHGLQLCFDHDPTTYTPGPNPPIPWTYKFTYPKTAFVGIWIFELFWDYLSAADTLNILNSWGLNTSDLYDKEAGIKNWQVFEKYSDAELDSEVRCLDSLWINLGYMPSLRHLVSKHENPAEFIGAKEDHLYEVFYKMKDIWDRIPDTEISIMWKYVGPLVFGREMYIDFVLPLPGGVVNKEDIEDLLPFTEDHLRNTLIAVKYTVESARQNWLGATNTQPTAKWWGDGEPDEFREKLLDLKIPMVLHAQFKEELLAATNKRFETFLGYPHTNYLLFPISMINEPFLTTTLALHHAGTTVKKVRAFLRLANDPFVPYTYKSLENWEKIVTLPGVNPERDNQADRTCSVLYNKHANFSMDEKSILYKYSMKDDMTTYQFSWNPTRSLEYPYIFPQTFLNLLALKEAFRMFREDKANLRQLPFNWTLLLELRNEQIQRFLPGGITSKFNEEQLFFMAYVRHVCRGSWKTHDDDYKNARYWLETEVLTLLMQMEEFSQVWNCDKNSFMNNLGKDRCMRWVP